MSQIGKYSLFFSGALVSCLLLGCGKDDDTSTASEASASLQTPEVNVAANSAVASEMTGVTRRQNERWADENGVEYLGDVPLDVFFDEPLTIARNQTQTMAGATSSGGGESMAVSALPVVSDAAGSSSSTETAVAVTGESWDSFVPIDVLQNEITNCRNFLNRSIQSYGDYKKVTLMIPGRAASMAVLASVAMEHPEDVNWKPDAIYIRDLARQMNEAPLQANKKDHERVLGLFEDIASTLDRSRPAGLAEPNPDDSIADVAGMDMVMVRLGEAEKRLKTEAGSEAAFDSKKDMINHEAAILATFSHVITLEGYGYADDEEFVGYANQIVKAAKKIQTATEANDFDTYELAVSKVSTSCSDCHSAYRNN